MMMRQILLLSLLPLLLAACATTPKFDTRGIDLNITPQLAVAQGDAVQKSRQLWGGVIVASTNLKEATQFEILAYPLDDNQKPDTSKEPVGRFIAEQTGYLETTTYGQGRLLTVSGTLQEWRTGRIGEAEYSYPVLKIEQLYLWPRRGESGTTQFHFGIGVMLHN